ncbi:MAG: D-tyrosyl-tRNA(Tyr) deacylase [Deltaproteobacteria bacterium]|nr:D-tyrosyl-tRNA(Tyr) deacylase [Deltaproteobacteria bacterium]
MKIVLQRVSEASVSVGGEVIGAIQQGLLLLVGIHKDDCAANLVPMRDKVLNLRVFPNEAGRFDRSLIDVKGSVLLVPQFTLFADTSKGRRPEFFEAMTPKPAADLFQAFVRCWEEILPGKVSQGLFGAEMEVRLTNHGPVTIII